MISTFTLNFLLSGTVSGGKWGQLSEPGLVSFGSFNDQAQPGYTVMQIPFFLILGLVGGLFGALFNAVNRRITLLRMRFVNKWKARRFLEVLIVAAATALIASLCSTYVFSCV